MLVLLGSLPFNRSLPHRPVHTCSSLLLQAKNMNAVVTAFDVRAAAKEQVEAVGAKVGFALYTA